MTGKSREIPRGLEHRRQPLLSTRAFIRRFGSYFCVAAGLVLAALGGGMLGYHELEGQSWLDAYLNSAMILGGMGPVNTLQTDARKLFAGTYALFSGLVFLVVTGLIFAPLVHRLLHMFHFDVEDLNENG